MRKKTHGTHVCLWTQGRRIRSTSISSLKNSFHHIPVKKGEMTVRLHTQRHQQKESRRRCFLYYFSVLCKSFKELFLFTLTREVPSLADAKVRLFPEPPNFSAENFQFQCIFLHTLDLCQFYTSSIPFIYFARARVAIRAGLGRNSARTTAQFGTNHETIRAELRAP